MLERGAALAARGYRLWDPVTVLEVGLMVLGRVGMVHIGVQDSPGKWVRWLQSRWPLVGLAGRSVFGKAGVAFGIVSILRSPNMFYSRVLGFNQSQGRHHGPFATPHVPCCG